MDAPLKKIIGFAAAYLLIAAAAVGYFVLTGSIEERAGGSDEAMATRGAALYAEHCARCHGAEREGQPGWRVRHADGAIPAPPLDGTGHAWEHADQHLFDMIKIGGAAFARRGEKSEMPAYAEAMSDAEIWAVIAYIKSRWPQEARDAQRRATLLGAFGHH